MASELGHSVNVSIHAPARGAMAVVAYLTFYRSFNSRTREGCDRFVNRDSIIGQVSIHAPARGAIPLSGYCQSLDMFQFTHPRGVR